MPYHHLFSPLSVGGQTLKNRIVHLATLTQYGQNNRVTQQLIDYHRARADGGAAMSIVEGLAVHSTSVPLRSVVTVFEDASLDGLARLAEAGETRDCRMLGQLWHVGRQQLWSPIDAPVGVSGEADAFSWTVPHRADISQIQELVGAFVDSARRLQNCGFSGVELHGAHGYLMTQFMSPWSNTRDDEYGGDLSRRLRFIREIIRGIRAVCGESFIVGLKLPAEEGVKGGIDLDEAIRITEHLLLESTPDYFAYSQGNFSLSLEDHNPNMSYRSGHFLHLHNTLRRHTNGVPVMAVGRIIDARHGEQILAEGSADLIGLGRALIADPALPEKARTAREDDTRPCIFCNLCWGEIHAGKPLLCIHNPKLPSSNEAGWKPAKATYTKKVVVVGAGPAGLEAAWNAAAAGHQVTVFDKNDDPGGAMRFDAQLPGRADVGKVYDYQWRQACRYGVDFRFGVHVQAGHIIALGPDVTVLATGARPSHPPALITDEPIFHWHDMVTKLNALDDVQRGVAVLFDMDHTDPTYAFADLVAQRYAKLVVITPRVQLARSVPYTNAIGIYRRLYQVEAEIITAAQPTRYEAGVVTYVNVFSGREQRIDDVTLFTYSTLRQANDELHMALRDKGLDVRLIGDSRSPRSVFSAIHEGFHQALTL